MSCVVAQLPSTPRLASARASAATATAIASAAPTDPLHRVGGVMAELAVPPIAIETATAQDIVAGQLVNSAVLATWTEIVRFLSDLLRLKPASGSADEVV